MDEKRNHTNRIYFFYPNIFLFLLFKAHEYYIHTYTVIQGYAKSFRYIPGKSKNRNQVNALLKED